MAALEGVEPACRFALVCRAVDAVSLVCVFSFSRRRASLRSGASSTRRRRVDAQRPAAAGRRARFVPIRARESAAFLFSWRRLEALQLLLDAAAHGSSALTGVSLFG